jgi:predicted transcriptional regulator
MYALPMSAQPDDITAGHDVIHLGGEAAVVVPLEEYRLLKVLEDHVTAEEAREAAVIAAHLADKAAGRVTGVVVTSPEDIEAALDDWENAPKWRG